MEVILIFDILFTFHESALTINRIQNILRSCSVYISIYTYSQETQQLYIISSDIKYATTCFGPVCRPSLGCLENIQYVLHFFCGGGRDLVLHHESWRLRHSTCFTKSIRLVLYKLPITVFFWEQHKAEQCSVRAESRIFECWNWKYREANAGLSRLKTVANGISGFCI